MEFLREMLHNGLVMMVLVISAIIMLAPFYFLTYVAIFKVRRIWIKVSLYLFAVVVMIATSTAFNHTPKPVIDFVRGIVRV